MAGQPHDMKQIAYDAWRGCGQNLVETARALKRDHNFTVTRQTLASWRDEYDWEGRAARAEAEAGKTEDICTEKGIMAIMSRQVQRYTDYFEQLPPGKMDNQAGFAFASLCNSLLTNLRKGSRPAGASAPADLRQITTPAEAIAALGEAVQAKINLALADPAALDLKGIKDMKQALDLLACMQAEYAPASSEKPKELSEDARRVIREIYGLK